MYIHVCMHRRAHEGQKLESQKERQTRISFLTIIIHILTGIIITIVQTSKLATWQKKMLIYIVQLDLY